MLLLLISRRFGADQSPLLLYCCCCSVAAVELLLLQRSCLAELPKYVRKQEVALELCLDPDESSPYFIIPSIEKPDTEGSFTITVFVPVCLGICFCVSRYLPLCVSVFASVCLGICPCVSRYLPLSPSNCLLKSCKNSSIVHSSSDYFILVFFYGADSGKSAEITVEHSLSICPGVVPFITDSC